MKVLVVGFSKTGTKSVDQALEILGCKVSEYVRNSIELFNDWIRYMEGKGTIEDLKKMYEGYDATSDMPTFFYWRDFLKAYPNIKLILMLRDEESWLKSWKRQINEDNSCALSFPLAYFSSTARKFYKFGHVMDRVCCNGPPAQRFNKYFEGTTDEKMKEIFRNHNKAVINGAPPDQLLIFKLKDGWKPLCKFLEKDVPEGIPFPHSNKNNEWTNKQLKNNPIFAAMYQEMYLTIAVMIATLSVAYMLFYVLYMEYDK